MLKIMRKLVTTLFNATLMFSVVGEVNVELKVSSLGSLTSMGMELNRCHE